MLKKTRMILLTLSLVSACICATESDECTDDCQQNASANMQIYGAKSSGANLLLQLLTELATKEELTTDVVENDEYNRQITISKGDEKAIINVHLTDQNSLFDDFSAGKVDVAITTRKIGDKEAKKIEKELKIKDMRSIDNEYALAVDALAVVVAPDNPLQQLSMATLKDIFSGKINNWSELGQEERAINIYVTNDFTSDNNYYKNIVLGREELAQSAVDFNFDTAVANAVTNDGDGIAIVSYAARGKSKAIALLDNCNIKHIPDSFALKSEQYPLARRIYVYRNTSAQVSEATNAFFHFSKSKQAQQLIANNGFKNHDIESKDFQAMLPEVINWLVLESDAAYHKEMGNFLKLVANGGQRLSSTYRFTIGNSQLDGKAKEDILRLAQYLNEQLAADENFLKQDILILAFTDSVGNFSRNKLLSQQRAEIISNELATHLSKELQPRLKAIGLGEVAPLACNDNKYAQDINRRVEIWLVPSS